MGKAEKGTPKDIAKRIKAKGLQKLKFWCQMCQKQCRDANGFKCHLTSESHLRQMKLFSEQANSVMTGYSREFEQTFLDTLRVRHTTLEVNANNVYQEIIQDKQHVHMNSTIWATLSDFVKYLGKTGKCRVRETERGWYIQYIEQDVSKLAQVEAYHKRQAAEAEAEKVENERIERQRVEAAKAWDRAQATQQQQQQQQQQQLNQQQQQLNQHGNVVDNSSSTSSNIKVTLAPKPTTNKTLKKSILLAGSNNVFGRSQNNDDDDDEEEEDNDDEHDLLPQPPQVSLHLSSSSNFSKKSSNGEKPPFSITGEQGKRNVKSESDPKAASSIKGKGSHHTTNTRQQQQSSHDDTWLLPNILVRIVDKKHLAPYVGRKAVVEEIYPIMDNNNSTTTTSAAKVTILDSGPDIQDGGQVLAHVSQSQLETVVPSKEGKRVYIVRGKYRGKMAKIVELNKKKCRAVLQLCDDDNNKDDGAPTTILERVDYDDFSKAA